MLTDELKVVARSKGGRTISNRRGVQSRTGHLEIISAKRCHQGARSEVALDQVAPLPTNDKELSSCRGTWQRLLRQSSDLFCSEERLATSQHCTKKG